VKKILLFFLIIFFASGGIACPICGCGGSNIYMGLFPDFRRGFMGIRYNHAQYHTTLFSDPSQYSTNYYNSMEVWGGMNIGSKFQVLGFIPYYLNKQVDDDGTTTPHGLGDVTIIGQYKVLRTTSVTHNNKVMQQQLWLGAGIKFATGSFNLDVNNPGVTVADVNAELGTGSTDFLLNGIYNLRIKNFGINATANYKINTVNKQQYKYGNKLATNLIAYYRLSAGKIGILPNAGIGYENVAGNLLSSKKVQYTGSSVTNAIAGVEFTFHKIGLGLNAQLPIAQNFAQGQTQLKFKGMAHITFAL
jgi:hypothetical protein